MALEIALVAEQNAARFYTRLCETTAEPELHTLYKELLAFENNHSGWLDKKVGEARRTSSGQKLV